MREHMKQDIRSARRRITRLSGILIATIALLATTACGHTGPAAIQNGRLSYNEAILATDNQQMLLAVIKERYAERAELVAVASITANIRVSVGAAIEVGVGDSDTYDGNLTPFSAGATYDENPTISYVPVSGAQYIRKLLAPIPLEGLALLTGSARNPAPICRMFISKVNTIKNSDHSFTAPDPRFDRFVELVSQLVHQRDLHFAIDPEHGDQLVIVIDRSTDTSAVAAAELLELLDLSSLDSGNSTLTIPIVMAPDARARGGIGIMTRSVYDLVDILASAVTIPPADLADGVATNHPAPSYLGEQLKVNWSEDRPDRAYVAVPFRGGWFSIDERDTPTKEFFRILTGLWYTAISDSKDKSGTPVLTVPVSR